ncbi:ATP-binding protein [bacterium]|jgi:signal transduction histidine kinase|nr:ATP-binding protein [bacterium]MDA7680513.1 ATP-binding protein [bacterium]
MKSIQNQLISGLLLWVFTLWILGGVAVTLIVRQGMIGRFDSELRGLASAARFQIRPINRQSTEAEVLDESDTGIYIQAWGLFQKGIVYRSQSLGEMNIPRPETFERDPHFHDLTLPNGESVRAIQVRMSFPMVGRPGRVPTYGIVVARNLVELNQGMARLLVAIVVVGLVGAALSVVFVQLTLRQGLLPLDRVSETVAEMDEESLQKNFLVDSMPAELQPICDRLNRLFGRLERSFARERRFSADLAHEFRTPLAELRAMIEVGLSWPDEFNEKKLSEMLQSTEQMQSILESLLTLSRLEHHGLEDRLELIDPVELIQRLWQGFDERATEKGIKLTCELPPRKEIEIEASLFHIILNNLFTNAVDYTPEDGGIELKLEFRGSTSFSLEMGNTNRGLKPSDLEHFFDRFWMGNQSRSSGGHFGLGLSLAKACAEAMKGHLVVALIENGARVQFRLEID